MILTRAHHHRLRNLAALASPHETCGVITSRGLVIELANLHPNPRDCFRMDLRHVKRHQIAAIFHSHPNGDPRPSREDLAVLRSCPFGYLIVTAGEVASYSL